MTAGIESGLKLQWQLDESSSKCMATITWRYQSQLTVNVWKICVRNLTWEQNDYSYEPRKYECSGSESYCPLLVQLRPGNRYRVIVQGCHSDHNDRESVVCQQFIEFRTGEVLSKYKVSQLHEVAKYTALSSPYESFYRPAICEYLYRNKPAGYFRAIFEDDGIMKTYLKDASGDLRSPINGEISGLFFCANVNRRDGKPWECSPFGDTRVLIRVKEILTLIPNMFFADFYCMNNRHTQHHVTIVLTKTGSRADEFCKIHLPTLDRNCNSFLCENDDGSVMVSSRVIVDVFVTEDLDLFDMAARRVAKMADEIPPAGIMNKTSQGGKAGEKSGQCEHCNIFPAQQLARRYFYDELF